MRVLTFDVEDWFHLLEHGATRTPEDWMRYPSRVERNTERLLELLQRHEVRATFFCLGWVARRFPQLVRAIAAAGHEIGSHSDEHQLPSQMPPPAFERDLARSLRVLEDLAGAPIRCFRAPGFGVGRETPWVFDVLIKHGIEVDCSVFPGRHAHGGMAGAPAQPHWLQCRTGRIRELPVSTTRVLGRDVVCSGGGYFRLAPYALVRRHLRRDPYVMSYLHPRDVDAGQPRLPGLGVKRSFTTYVGIDSAWNKLDVMLQEFDFLSVGEAAMLVDWAQAPVVTLAHPVPQRPSMIVPERRRA